LHSTTTSQSHRSRGSIIVAASDALNTLKFRRRPKSLRRQSTSVKNAPIILPEVIEISAARIAEDNQERLRLRDAAAQSLGLGPVLQSGSNSYGSLDDEEVARAEDDVSAIEQSADQHSLLVSPQASTSLKPSHSKGLHSTHSRTNSSTFSPTTSTSISTSPIPPFPATPADLFQYIQKSSILPKFYPPPSIRIFSFNKQWKLRHIVFTSPPSARASYLHLFKATKRLNDQASRETELERLEIDENSVVFVAEEELVGGRKGVIKVGGIDTGIVKKELNSSHDDSRTTWILQVEDQKEAQNWIEAIKGSILQLRSMQAGLGSVTHGMSGTEPRGDMDVMLSLRAQSLYVPPSPTSTGHGHFSRDSRRPQTSASLSTNSSYSSTKAALQPTAATSSPSRALKGLFGGRSRSPSGASTTDPRANDRNEDSFAVMGNNLMSLMKSTNNSASTFSSTSNQIPNLPNGTHGSASILDRKIAPSGSFPQGAEALYSPSLLNTSSWIPPSTPTGRSQEKVSRTLSLQIPLQPPPRKRWTTVEAEPAQNQFIEEDLLDRPNPTIQRNFYGSAGANGSLSAVGGADLTTSDRASALSTPRAPSVQSVSVSIQSVSSLASAGGSSPVTGSGGRHSVETKRSSRRWSRQGTLPQRMTPPSGPPPAAPASASPAQSLPGIPTTSPHPYSNGGTSGRARSGSSVHSVRSDQSGVSGLPSFGKRSSITSSVQISPQTSSGISSHLHPSAANVVHTRPGSSHRASMPPPRGPAPTSALPPAPATKRGSRRDSEPPKPSGSFSSQSTSSGSPMSRLRDRAFRISMLEPRPPPLTNLPPRPDERPSSPPTSLGSQPLPPIPASPNPPPSQPEHVLSESRKSTPTTSRHSSLKKRLRILSAPASAPTGPLPLQPLNLVASHPLRNSLQLQCKDSNSPAHTPPGTPLGEHIAHPKVQNDPSFITGTVLPVTPSSSAAYFPLVDISSGSKSASARTLSMSGLPPPESDDMYPGFQSLSPPPRRMSKQLNQLDIDHAYSSLRDEHPNIHNGAPISQPSATMDERESFILTPSEEMDNMLTDNLSRRTSAMSVGIINV
jgi:hypothetical protein